MKECYYFIHVYHYLVKKAHLYIFSFILINVSMLLSNSMALMIKALHIYMIKIILIRNINTKAIHNPNDIAIYNI